MSKDQNRKRVLPEDSDLSTWINLSALTDPEKDDFQESKLQSLRPTSFDDYIGQEKLKENLLIACNAAKKRGEPLDHLLLHGPPGLGKTSMARIVANHLDVGFKSTAGPVIERPGDLAAILTSLQPHDVLFIDEIHRLPRVVEEVLYPAMEDFNIDIIIGRGPAARSVKVDVKPFTLIGATTRTGLLTSPLRDRFGIVLRLGFYSPEELSTVVQRSASLLNVSISKEAAHEIGKRSRGTPRIANRLLNRVRDFAEERADGKVDLKATRDALNLLEIDARGLDRIDRQFLETIIDKFHGGPVGIETISAALGEEKDTLEDVYEPFLVQEGLVARTRRGREVTELGYKHIGRKPTGTHQKQLEL